MGISPEPFTKHKAELFSLLDTSLYYHLWLSVLFFVFNNGIFWTYRKLLLLFLWLDCLEGRNYISSVSPSPQPRARFRQSVQWKWINKILKQKVNKGSVQTSQPWAGPRHEHARKGLLTDCWTSLVNSSTIDNTLTLFVCEGQVGVVCFSWTYHFPHSDN